MTLLYLKRANIKKLIFIGDGKLPRAGEGIQKKAVQQKVSLALGQTWKEQLRLKRRRLFATIR
jgi:hypothetical protein